MFRGAGKPAVSTHITNGLPNSRTNPGLVGSDMGQPIGVFERKIIKICNYNGKNSENSTKTLLDSSHVQFIPGTCVMAFCPSKPPTVTPP